MRQPLKSVEQLERLLSEPTEGVVKTLQKLEGDFLLLGVAGKIGPSLARMIKRASDVAGVHRRVIGVSRFANRSLEGQLQELGIETIRCDLLDETQLGRLPQAKNVIYMAGMKFGATKDAARTWAVNSYLPGVVSNRFRHSRLIVFSTGNIYGLSPLAHGGSKENEAANPAGEYAMSCLGRERIFEYFSRSLKIPITMIRLNYACELRYGVLVDLALRVWTGHTIDLTMGYLNTIWQGDANAQILQSFDYASSPPYLLNITGPETLSVRKVGEDFGRLFGKKVVFTGVESDQALLSNSSLSQSLFGHPRVSAAQMMRWIAHWIIQGGPNSGKPTHFESRDGKF